MPESIDPGRSEYLQRVADRLPFDESGKLDILRELAGHLADSTARFEGEGLIGDAAERAAIERLGPPEQLADELTKAHHSPRRLLAAAGAGTWAAVGGVVYGYLLTALALTGVSIAAFILGSYLHWFGPSTGYGLDGTTTSLVALGAGAYAAGHKLTATIAGRAGYRISLVRRATALVGGGLVLVYSLVGWTGSLNWAEVGILLSLPAWFVIGAWRSNSAQFPSRQWRLRAIGLAFVVVLAALGLGFDQQPAGSAGSGGFQPAGIEKIGLPTPDAIIAATQADGFGGVTLGRTTRIWVLVMDPAVLAGWRDFRVEAWRAIGDPAIDPDLGIVVDPAATAPYAIGPAALDSGLAGFTVDGINDAIPAGVAQLSGSVTIDRNPNVTLAWVALTGVAPDGKRYLLASPSYETTTFHGTALDWLTAVASTR